jgi:hypothetical protein
MACASLLVLAMHLRSLGTARWLGSCIIGIQDKNLHDLQGVRLAMPFQPMAAHGNAAWRTAFPDDQCAVTPSC